MPLSRSLLFVPGNNERFVEKSRGIGADIVCLDLEDSVPAGQKGAARSLVRRALGGRFEAEAYVRTNSPDSGMLAEDLRAACVPGLRGVVVPKVHGPGDAEAAAGMLAELGSGAGIVASIESARGVASARAIASCEGVEALVFGVFDLLHDMGVEYGADSGGASYSRSKVPVDARAAGIPAIDSVWQDTGDAAGLEADCRLGRSLGYSGKSLIHPSQVAAAHASFAPDPGQVRWAERVCEAYLESCRAGRGATTVDGRMVDEVHYKQARRLLGAAGRPTPP